MPGVFVKVCKLDLPSFFLLVCQWQTWGVFRMSRFVLRDQNIGTTSVNVQGYFFIEVSFYIIFSKKFQGLLDTPICPLDVFVARSWWENIGMACCYGLASHRLLGQQFHGAGKGRFLAAISWGYREFPIPVLFIKVFLLFFRFVRCSWLNGHQVSCPPRICKKTNFQTLFLCLGCPTVAMGQCLADGAGFSFLPLAWSVQFRDWMLGCSHEKHSLFNFVLVDSSFEVQVLWKQGLCLDFEKLHDGWVKCRDLSWSWKAYDLSCRFEAPEWSHGRQWYQPRVGVFFSAIHFRASFKDRRN